LESSYRIERTLPFIQKGLLTFIINPNTTNITNTAITNGITILIRDDSKLLSPNHPKNFTPSLIKAYTIIEQTEAIIIFLNISVLLYSFIPYYNTIKERGNFSVTPLDSVFY
jgi:hypothetical protein